MNSTKVAPSPTTVKSSGGAAGKASAKTLARKISVEKKLESKQQRSHYQSGVSEDVIQELKTAFALLDKNQDGRISVSEFQEMLKNFEIEVPDNLILTLFKQASATGECVLKESEFLDWISSALSQSPEDTTEDLCAAFRVFDKDQDGYITKDELRAAMELIGEPLTEQELSGLLELADVDHDGQINYEEFAKMLL